MSMDFYDVKRKTNETFDITQVLINSSIIFHAFEGNSRSKIENKKMKFFALIC